MLPVGVALVLVYLVEVFQGVRGELFCAMRATEDLDSDMVLVLTTTYVATVLEMLWAA